MRQGTYLNVILTINAVLLAALVWVSAGPSEANAQVHPHPEPSNPTRFSPFTGTPFPVNSGAQRIRMIELLEQINASMANLNQMMEDGSASVRVSNAAEIRGN